MGVALDDAVGMRGLVDHWWLRVAAGLQLLLVLSLFTPWGLWVLGGEVFAIWIGLMVWAATRRAGTFPPGPWG